MTTDKSRRMIERNQSRNKEKRDIALSVIEAMVLNDEKVAICDLTRRTGLSRAYFYKNKEIREAVINAQKKQEGRVLQDRKKEVFDTALKEELSICKRKILLLQAENEKLKEENKNLRETIEKKRVAFIRGL